jgi:hypothetical protein
VVSSLPRTTSDHVPLKIEISTNIPKPQVFLYCNNWKFKPDFKDLVTSSWNHSAPRREVTGTLVPKIKTTRQKANGWKKSLRPHRTNLNNAKRMLNLLDWIEERCTLTNLEHAFKLILKCKIAHLIHKIAVAARQIGKLLGVS